MGGFSGNPPLPTDQGPLPAPDFPAVNAYSPTTNAQDTLNFMTAHADDLSNLISRFGPIAGIVIKLILVIAKIVGQVWIDILQTLVPLQVDYNNAMADLHKAELPIGVPAARDMIADEIALVLSALGSTDTRNYLIPGSNITTEANTVYDALIKPFLLWTNSADIRQPNTGFVNADFLLRRAMALNLAEYTLDSMRNLVGFGWIAQLQPILSFIDRSINPSNIVRQAMEQAYSYLMKVPMQRDLNRSYPIKDLGVTALCKLYIRGAIDESTYLDKCLDAGLNNTQAQQLILETAKLLSTSQIGTLMNHQFITSDDAKQQLLEQGYPDWQANAILYLETHDRFFSIQDRVGNEAVTAWKAGKINQAQLEDLLTNLNFTSDEINLLEIEGQFTKSATDQKPLTYSQIKDMYKANIVDLDYVITFLTNENYAADDITRLVLLDFVQAEERALKEAELQARIRVQAEQQRAAAATEAAKNETDLANARLALASQLDDIQKQLGLLETLPSIMDLLNIALP